MPPMKNEAQHKNEVHLAGELAKDPVTRFTPTGKKVSTLTIATRHKQWVEYHRVVCWEQMADKVETLIKGEFVKIVGRLQTRSWEDKQSGQKKYLTEIVAFQLVVPGQETTEEAPAGGTAMARAILSPSTPAVEKNLHSLEISDADIPF